MIRRRDFITLLGGAVAWPLAAPAQQPMPVVGFINGSSQDSGSSSRQTAAFRKGLSETGYVEGQNVLVEYHWLDGHYERVPAVVDDLVRRHAAVIAAPGFAPAAIAAKAATSTIPIVFAVGQDPVRLGLVASLERPGGNATGFNYFAVEVEAKRLGMLRELMPKAVRIALLVNPAGEPTTLNELVASNGRLGLETIVLNAGSSRSVTHEAADFDILPRCIACGQARDVGEGCIDLAAIAQTPCSSSVMDFSAAAASSLPRWRREIACPQAMRSGHMSKLAG